MEISDEKLYKKTVDMWGEQSQMMIALEELAELQQAISKWGRARSIEELEPCRQNIIEEIADVEVMIEQISRMARINSSEVKDFKDKRLDRLRTLVKEEEEKKKSFGI